MKWVGCTLVFMTLASIASGSVAREKWKDAPEAQSRAIAVAYTRCAVRQDRTAVVAFLDAPFGTDDPAALDKALPPSCLNVAIGHPVFGPSQLRASPLLIRGLLFEALYAFDYKKPPVVPRLDTAPSLTYDTSGVDRPGQALRHDYRALMRIGDCTARRAPGPVEALLSSAPASDTEAHAIADLHDAWTGCLPAQRDLTFSVQMERATVAEPFYRMIRIAAPTANHG